MALYVIEYEASVDRDAEPYNVNIGEDVYDVPDALAGEALTKFILARLTKRGPKQFYINLKIRQ